MCVMFGGIMKADVSMDLTAWLLGLAKYIYVVHHVCCDVRASLAFYLPRSLAAVEPSKSGF